MNTIIFSKDAQPVDVIIGIDQYTFEIKAGSPFAGIKNIPNGLHVIHFSSAAGEESEGIRYGYWFEDPRNWFIHYDEDAGCFNMTREEHEDKYDRMVETYHQLMVNYPKIEETNWHELTRLISWQQVEKLLSGVPAYVDSSMTTYEEMQFLKGKLNKQIRRLTTQDDHYFNYTKINFKSRDAIRDECKMQDFMDRSHYLNEVIVRRDFQGHINRLLGELQFAFCNMMIFGNYGSSLQWHNIIELVTTSTQISSGFIEAFDNALALQLEILPQEYCETLINEPMWQRCLRRSHQSKKLPYTTKAYTDKLPGLVGSSDEESQSNSQDLPNIDSDEDDDYKPTVGGGVYYVRR